MANRNLPSLDIIEIATPCDVSWDGMQGDDFVRRCEHCQLNVFNLSSLSREEAAELVFQSEGRMCVRLFRRADGTVITQDCPVGLRRVRRRLARSLAAIGALVTLLTCGIAQGRSPKTNSPQTVAGPLTKLIQWIDPPDLVDQNIRQADMGLMMPVSNGPTPDCGPLKE